MSLASRRRWRGSQPRRPPRKDSKQGSYRVENISILYYVILCYKICLCHIKSFWLELCYLGLIMSETPRYLLKPLRARTSTLLTSQICFARVSGSGAATTAFRTSRSNLYQQNQSDLFNPHLAVVERLDQSLHQRLYGPWSKAATAILTTLQ